MDGFDEGEAPDQPQELVREPQRALWSRWRASVMWRRISRLLRRAERAAADDAPPEEVEVEPEPPVDTRTFEPWARLPPELATHVLSLVPAASLAACGRASRTLRDAAADENLWRFHVRDFWRDKWDPALGRRPASSGHDDFRERLTGETMKLR